MNSESGQKRLLEDLRSLRDALQRLDRSDEESSPEDLVAVATICRGLSKEQWHDIVRTLDLTAWFALPFKGSQYPALQEIQQRIEDLTHASEHDPLTGLLNRRGFARMLQMEIERAKRFRGLLSLALIDLDDFKQANDTYGHPCGDQVLVSLADLIKSKVRKINVSARLGGEEFAVLLPGSAPAQARAMLNRLQRFLADTSVECSQHSLHMTFSAGVACCEGGEISSEALLEQADQALYRAKRQGKDQVVCAPFQPGEEPSPSTMVRPEEKKFLFDMAKDREQEGSDPE